MKCTFNYLKIWFLLLIFSASGSVFSQSIASLNSAGTTYLQSEKERAVIDLKKGLDEAADFYEVRFSYRSSDLRGLSVRRRNFERQSLQKTLSRWLGNTALRFEQISDQHFVIVPRINSESPKLLETKEDKVSGQTKTPTQRRAIRSLPRLSQYTPPLREVSTVFEVKGTITDESDLPLIGATIREANTTTGTVTDLDGNFTLSVSNSSASLQVSYTGYQTLSVPVSNRSRIDIKMEPDASLLEEVVVVGYGTVRKEDLTGAVGVVKSEDLIAFPTSNLNQAIQGRVAGVQVGSTNGTPGAAPKITIRGITSPFSNSSPLFVVDGFVGGMVPPAEEIASVEILKDASASAIYGSRGSNGVVIITTKSGKAGRVNIEVNTSLSTQNIVNKLELADRSQYESYQTALNPNFTPSDFNGQTDWQDEVFRTGLLNNNQIAISGGSDKVKYFVSGNYLSQRGIVISSDFDRLSFNSNLSIDVNDKFNISTNVFARRTTSNGVISQERTGGVVLQGVISGAYLFAPDQGVFEEDGAYSTTRFGAGFNNPVAIADDRRDERMSDNLQINLRGKYDFTDWVSLTSTAGYRLNSGFNGRYVPSSLVAGEPGGVADLSTNRNTNFLTEHYLTFSRTLAGNHNFKLITGVSYQNEVFQNFRTGAENFITDNFSFYNLGNGTLIDIPGSGFAESELFSTYGRLEYNFASRYLITATLRNDGSSRLSPGNKYKTFPSVAVAWNLKNEGFLTSSNVVDLLKLRASLGNTGNQSIGIYSTIPTLSTDVYSDESNNVVTALNPGQIPNSDLTWETSRQINLGVDANLWNGALTITADWYQTNTKDLLFSVPLNPLAGGTATQRRNLGEIQNSGFELALGTTRRFGELRWSGDFNISFNRNKVLSLPDGDDIFYATVPDHINGLSNGSQSQVLRVGEPIGVFYGYIYDGVYQSGDTFTPGSGFEERVGGEHFRDIASGRDENNDIIYEADGQLNSNDRTIIGDPNPDFIFGFNNTFEYKGFDLNFFFQGAQGGDLYNFTRLELEMLSGGNNITANAANNRWTEQNTNTDVPAALTGRTARVSTRFVEDGSYIRLKNLSLGYTLPRSALERVGLTKARLFISGQNLLTITDYQGVDPEVSYRNSSRNLGLDYGSYPNTKGVTFGLNLVF